MSRSVPLLALALGLLLSAAFRPASGAEPLSLSRDQVNVTADSVRLGDLFTNTGAKAGMVVENAPPPGTQAVYDVHRLAAIARAHGLTWQARSWSERVLVERAGQTIGSEQILAALREAIERDAPALGPIEIETSQRDPSLTLPADRPATIAVEGLRRNAATGQFTAVVVAPAGDSQAVRLNIAGRIHRVIEVPTLARRMMPGDVIGRDDIVWTTMRADQVPRNAFVDAERIIGSTPTRAAVAGRMLFSGDLRAPRIVAKGGLVTMLLRTPNMVLTSRGRALEDGARGDTIRIMNTQSKTVVEGEVTSAGTVTVTSTHFMPDAAGGPQAAALTPARR